MKHNVSDSRLKVRVMDKGYRGLFIVTIAVTLNTAVLRA